ncbi:MAG: thioredoxin family protein [Candidatus Bilamarchaeaceae archaeon]
MLDENTKNEAKRKLSEMKEPVKLIYFDRQTQMNEHIKELLKELVELSGKIQLEMRDLTKDVDLARQYGVDTAPVIILRGKNIKGDPRYYGIPSGYEFPAFLEVLKVGSGVNGASDFVKGFFDSLPEETKIEVFVTPVCPHCPTSAYIAMKFAIASAKVKGYVYEAMEFPEIATKYRVMGVPKTVINEGKGEFVGGYPEDVAFIQIKKILAAR